MWRMGLDVAGRARPPPQGASSRRRTFGSSDASGTSEHLTCAFTSPRCDCTRSTGTLDALPLPELLKWPLDHSSGRPVSLNRFVGACPVGIAVNSPHLPLCCLSTAGAQQAIGSYGSGPDQPTSLQLIQECLHSECKSSLALFRLLSWLGLFSVLASCQVALVVYVSVTECIRPCGASLCLFVPLLTGGRSKTSN